MRKLRQALRDANVSWSAQPLPGWAGNDAQHPCEWPRVKCDDQRHITYL